MKAGELHPEAYSMVRIDGHHYLIIIMHHLDIVTLHGMHDARMVTRLGYDGSMGTFGATRASSGSGFCATVGAEALKSRLLLQQFGAASFTHTPYARAGLGAGVWDLSRT